MGKPETPTPEPRARRWVSVSLGGGVGVVRIDRPPANTLDFDLLHQVSEALAEAGTRPDVGALVVTGTGDCFVAGADITMLERLSPGELMAFISTVRRAFDDVKGSQCPRSRRSTATPWGAGWSLRWHATFASPAWECASAFQRCVSACCPVQEGPRNSSRQWGSPGHWRSPTAAVRSVPRRQRGLVPGPAHGCNPSGAATPMLMKRAQTPLPHDATGPRRRMIRCDGCSQLSEILCYM